MAEQGPRVLIVENAGHWLDFLQALLHDVECQLSVADSFEQGLALLDQGPYCLAIVDVRLEDSDLQDTSGLRLVKEAWAKEMVDQFFILSGYPVEDRVRDELGPEIPHQHFDKADVLGEDFETHVHSLIDEARNNDSQRTA